MHILPAFSEDVSAAAIIQKHHPPEFSLFECGLAPATLQMASRPSALDFVPLDLRLPASWTEPLWDYSASEHVSQHNRSPHKFYMYRIGSVPLENANIESK